MAITFYLKHRPQNFRELDVVSAREGLEKIFQSDRFPHAFLFSGPRGIGKTSAARIVAKAVNCVGVRPDGFEPCNQCSACISVTKGTNVDVLEIDAASNRGIDDIKELREKIKLAPALAKYKVYIIDEVHMLTAEAFNALLKTLEEPPGHALFILCTTDPEKLPKTIISRCHCINFKRATLKEIVGRLKKICEEEQIENEDKALEEIARMADGGLRDAVKVLEQAAFSGKVTLAEVQKIAEISGDFSIEDFLAVLEKGDVTQALVWINQAFDQGANLKVLTEVLLNRLRLILLSRFGFGETVEKVNLKPVEIESLIRLFSRAYAELKTAVIPQLPLEMAVIEWCSIKTTSDSKPSNSNNELDSKSKSKSEESTTQTSYSLEDVLSKWPLILEKVKPLNHSVVAFLKACRPVTYEGGFLIVEVFYKFHKDQLETEKCRRIFEKSASEVLGSEVKLRCSLNENAKPLTKPLPVLSDFPPSAQKFTPPKARASLKGDDDDIIKMAEEIFNKNVH